MKELINYVNRNNEDVCVYYESSRESFVIINYMDVQKSYIINDLKNGFYYLMAYMNADKILFIDLFDDLTLEVIKDALIDGYEEYFPSLVQAINKYER